MNEVFLKKTVLFLGTSMEGLSMDVRNIVFERSPPEQHFALVTVEGKVWEATALGLAERWRIQVPPYNPTVGHAEFAEFVSRLTGAVAGTAGGATDAAAAGVGKDA